METNRVEMEKVGLKVNPPKYLIKEAPTSHTKYQRPTCRSTQDAGRISSFLLSLYGCPESYNDVMQCIHDHADKGIQARERDLITTSIRKRRRADFTVRVMKKQKHPR